MSEAGESMSPEELWSIVHNFSPGPDDDLAALERSWNVPPRIPGNYSAAMIALRRCIRANVPAFPTAYEAARAALAECLAVDECATWPAPEGYRSYAWQASDALEMEKLERRVEQKAGAPRRVPRDLSLAQEISVRAIRRSTEMRHAAEAARKERIEREGLAALAWMDEWLSRAPRR